MLHVVLSDTESDRCCYNIHLRCDKGLEVPDAKVCGICIIDAYRRIVDKRKQLTVFAWSGVTNQNQRLKFKAMSITTTSYRF